MDNKSDEKVKSTKWWKKFKSDDILFCLRKSLEKFAVAQNNEIAGAIASSLIIIRPIRNRTLLALLNIIPESII